MGQLATCRRVIWRRELDRGRKRCNAVGGRDRSAVQLLYIACHSVYSEERHAALLVAPPLVVPFHGECQAGIVE
eukprot:scaffold89865_cov53-Phaeocystis_antarctica.AAC.1